MEETEIYTDPKSLVYTYPLYTNSLDMNYGNLKYMREFLGSEENLNIDRTLQKLKINEIKRKGDSKKLLEAYEKLGEIECKLYNGLTLETERDWAEAIIESLK